ncbi:MAG TPA: hypothetical protein VGM31_07375 [Puia sp.]|jgi:hypothetical protein
MNHHHDDPSTVAANPIPMSAVQQKVTAFHSKMTKVAGFLKDKGATRDLIFSRPEEFLLQFYIDKDGLDRLVTISGQDGFSKMGVFFGLEDPDNQGAVTSATDGFGRLTCCFVGLDEDQQPLKVHFPSANGEKAIVEAEDTWPPPPPPPPHPQNTLSLANNANDVFDFFEP